MAAERKPFEPLIPDADPTAADSVPTQGTGDVGAALPVDMAPVAGKQDPTAVDALPSNGQSVGQVQTAEGAAPQDQSAPVDPSAASELGEDPQSAGSPAGTLEELILPPSIQAPAILASGTVFGPNGELEVGEHLGSRGRINRYAATWHEGDSEPIAIELREANLDEPSLAREIEILSNVQYGMLPKLYQGFATEDRRYLAVESTAGLPTLSQMLQGTVNRAEAISVVLQLTQALRRLHETGWTLVGLSPADVMLGQPLKIDRLASAVRIGEAPTGPLHVPGYSAPEVAHQSVVTGKEDVYTLGAILYHALAGHRLPESGAELGALPVLVQTPGGPQLLTSALALAEERIDIEGFYQRLLQLKMNLGEVALALEIASGTSVGLNPTRTTNEDSCGYMAWSVGGAEGMSFRALLCVADGMGGMEAGEVASSAALRTMLQGAVDPEPDPVALIRKAAPAVHAASEGRQVGTTATCVYVNDGVLILGHVGDTRAYLFRDSTLTQLTEDHSLVAAMVASGVISKAEARGHPDSNKVLRSLGSQRELPDGYVDDLTAAHGQPTLQIQADDWLLLCSDGIWGQVDDEELQVILSEALDCPTVVRVAIDRALAAGAPDNVAIIAARCVQTPAR